MISVETCTLDSFKVSIEEHHPTNGVRPWTTECDVSWTCSVLRVVGGDAAGRLGAALLTITVS